MKFKCMLAGMSLMALTGCETLIVALMPDGTSPGEHSFVSVDLVKELPTSIRHTRKGQDYLRFRMRSDRPLSGDDFNALYVDVSVCPFSETREAFAWGPMTLGNDPLDLPRAEHIPTPEGQYDYFAFMPLRGKFDDRTTNRPSSAGSYDLNEIDADLCFRIIHTTMPKAEFSNIFKVPRSQIAAAFARKKASVSAD